MKFSDIPGLESVKTLLTEAVRSNHSAHAQLFLGAPGALNLPLAVAHATYLHCENPGDDACGSCAACVKSQKYIHPDTHFVFPANNVKNDKDDERLKADLLKSWRSFLTEQPFGSLDDWTSHYGGEDKLALISKEESREIIKTLALKPFESRNKVMIIWQPETMHPSAANGILKILEEPAPNTYFILVTNAADKLLPTIISRTQIVTVPLLTDEAVAGWMRERYDVPGSRLDKIVQLSNGNLAMALHLLEDEENDHTERFTEWMRACYRKNYPTLLTMADDYHTLGKLNQRNLLLYSLNMMRETLLYTNGAERINRTGGEELKFVKDFSKVMDFEKIERTSTLINEASYHLERNGSARMIFLDLSIQIGHTLNPKPA